MKSVDSHQPTMLKDPRCSHRRLLLILLFCAIGFVACGKGSDHLALVGVTVIDSLGNPPRPNQVVLGKMATS